MPARGSMKMPEGPMAIGPIQLICFGVRGEEQRKAVVQALRAHSERGPIRILDAGYVRASGESRARPEEKPSLSLPIDVEHTRYDPVYGAAAAPETGTLARGTVGDTVRVDLDIGAVIAERNLDESVQQAQADMIAAASKLSSDAALYMALIEHRWAPAQRDTLQALKEALQTTGVAVLAEQMIRPSPLALLAAEFITTQHLAVR
jgi:hypothetical protein